MKRKQRVWERHPENNLITSGSVEYNHKRYSDTVAVGEQFLTEKLAGHSESSLPYGPHDLTSAPQPCTEIFVRNYIFPHYS